MLFTTPPMPPLPPPFAEPAREELTTPPPPEDTTLMLLTPAPTPALLENIGPRLLDTGRANRGEEVDVEAEEGWSASGTR